MDDKPGHAKSSLSSLELQAGYALEVSDGVGAGGLQKLDVRAPDGKICLSITIGPDGPRVELSAASLSISAKGAIELEGEQVKLASRGDLVLKSGGDLIVEADKAIEMTAFEAKIAATTGDLMLEANDDVRVDGERIRLNAPDAPDLRRIGRRSGDDVDLRSNVDLPRIVPKPDEGEGS